MPADAGSRYAGALLGGYGGTWVSIAELGHLHLTEPSVRQVGATLGAGIVILLSNATCPLVEVSRVVSWMAGQGAGQCGPCATGLPKLATELADIAFGAPRRGAADRIGELCDLVEGRGACKHPDGVARFVRSAWRVFAHHVADHVHRGPCRAVGASNELVVPRPRRLHVGSGV